MGEFPKDLGAGTIIARRLELLPLPMGKKLGQLMQVGGGPEAAQWDAIAGGGVTARADDVVFVNEEEVLAGKAIGYW
jgi:hypothetical protein